jgi:hypothetical protein
MRFCGVLSSLAKESSDVKKKNQTADLDFGSRFALPQIESRLLGRRFPAPVTE